MNEDRSPSDRERIFVWWNPRAGRGEAEDLAERIRAEASRRGHTVTLLPSDSVAAGRAALEDAKAGRIDRLVIVGFFTNMCVETTTRMANNLGFDTYLVPDGCATTNRVGPDGTDHDPEVVHQMSVANLDREFCTAISPDAAAALLTGDRADLDRRQGNE